MSDYTREQVDLVAEAIAKAADADYWTDEIAEWENAEEWYREAQPEEHPGWAYEDREWFRKQALAALAAAGVTKTEPEYEYTWAGTDDEGDDWLMDDWFATVGEAEQYANSRMGNWVRTDNGRLARRVKAGAWEPAPNQSDGSES